MIFIFYFYFLLSHYSPLSLSLSPSSLCLWIILIHSSIFLPTKATVFFFYILLFVIFQNNSWPHISHSLSLSLSYASLTKCLCFKMVTKNQNWPPLSLTSTPPPPSNLKVPFCFFLISISIFPISSSF